MESHLPTRPSSDLHRRITGHKRPLLEMDSLHLVSPSPSGRTRNRSSSFSSFGRSLSRLLPTNRKEQGGTLRAADDENNLKYDETSPCFGLVKGFGRDGKLYEAVDIGDDMRKIKSWSPRKFARVVDKGDGECCWASKIKKPSSLKRLWELHKPMKNNDGAEEFSNRFIQLTPDGKSVRLIDGGSVADRTPARLHLAKSSLSLIFRPPQPADMALKQSPESHEQKKVGREQRRSFRESDDFLGVQGVNPRTGYTDTSITTSSTERFVMSEPTRIKLDEDERRMESASREFKAALERREKEMRRLDLERDRRRRDKKERAERKRADLKTRMRKDGRWKSEGNRWSMVVEPELSPILQSFAGSPAPGSAPSQLPLPISSTGIRSPAIGPRTEAVEDYFGRVVSPWRTAQRYRKPYVEGPSNTPLALKYQTPHARYSSHASEPKKYHSPFVESAPNTPQQSRLPVISGKAYGVLPVSSSLCDGSAIRLKETGSPSLRCRASSTETTVHNARKKEPVLAELPDGSRTPRITHRIAVTTPGETTHALSLSPPELTEQPFLGGAKAFPVSQELPENEVIASSFQSLSMIPTPVPHQWHQSPQATFPAKHILSLSDFPPVILRDPITARTPLVANVTSKPAVSQVQPSKVNLMKREPESPPLRPIIPITTITGLRASLCPLGQLDGPKEVNEAQSGLKHPVPATSIPLTTDFRLRENANGMQSASSQIDLAGTDTSLTPPRTSPSTPQKRQVVRYCQKVSLEMEKSTVNNKYISTSTSLQTQNESQRSAAAQSAARVALSHASPQKLGKSVKARSSSLASPKTTAKAVGDLSGPVRKIFSGGNVDIGNPSKMREDVKLNSPFSQKRIEEATRLKGPSTNGREDGFVVWATVVDKKVRSPARKATGEKKMAASAVPKEQPENALQATVEFSGLHQTYHVFKKVAQTAWWFVAPVFNPHSGLRFRWVRNKLTWQDMVLIGAAGIFGGGAFLFMVLCARVLGVGLQIVKGVVGVCKVLAGL